MVEGKMKCNIHMRHCDSVSETHVMDAQDAFSALSDILAWQMGIHLAQVHQHGQVYLWRRLVPRVNGCCGWWDGELGNEEMGETGVP